eukprot:TRINITY_DN5928_c0_g1_i1.p1 TRINITY_DN5928_c0_g1~~TRINITY_DN5928_c0_g1_i1.p1  ORF type:complete len:416 (-),score=81.65 TRINITY_DN5928_c0_g1_i1:15-1262(-)
MHRGQQRWQISRTYLILIGMLILAMLWFGTWEIRRSILENNVVPEPVRANPAEKDLEPPAVVTTGVAVAPKEPEKRKMKMILYWNPIYVDGWVDRLVYFGNCPIYKECDVTQDQKRLNESDAVVIYTPHFWDSSIKPPYRSPDQVWIMFSIESPYITHYTVPFKDMNFNWTMTYRLDADITYLYELNLPYKTAPPKKKFGTVMWMAYHCNARNRRIDYVEELMKHMQVDSYGQCLHTRDSIEIETENGQKKTIQPTGRMEYMSEDNWEMYRIYKFYLAFENVNCLDYVTEKFWRPLIHGSVPVVFGAPNIDDFAPAPHSIIKVSDFATPKDLADYLKMLDANETLYNEYHAWRNLELHQLNKKYQQMVHQRSGCQLCEKLHTNKEHMSYNDREAWNVESQCIYTPENKPTGNSAL